MREQLIGCGALRTKISLTDRRLRITFDRNQFPILMENQLTAADAAIRANGARDFCVIDARVHRARFVRHRLQAGAIFALADLPNERPFRKQREHNLYLFLRGWSGLQSFESVTVQLAKLAKTNASE